MESVRVVEPLKVDGGSVRSDGGGAIGKEDRDRRSGCERYIVSSYELFADNVCLCSTINQDMGRATIYGCLEGEQGTLSNIKSKRV